MKTPWIFLAAAATLSMSRMSSFLARQEGYNRPRERWYWGSCPGDTAPRFNQRKARKRERSTGIRRRM